MSSLYGRKKVVTSFEDEPEDLAVVSKFKPTLAHIGTAPKQKRKFIDSDDEDDDDDDDYVMGNRKGRKVEKKVMEMTDSDWNAQVAARVKAVKASHGAELLDIAEVKQVCISKSDDALDEKSKQLLDKISDVKKSLSRCSKSSSSTSTKPLLRETIDLEANSPSTFIVPTIKRAVTLPYSSLTQTSSSRVDLSLSELQALAGANSSSSSKAIDLTASCSSSSRENKAQPQMNIPQCKLRTRLNGVHERKWSIPGTEPFSKLRASIAGVYGVKSADVILEFDGDAIQDKDTPSGLGMEDNDIVEAKVPKALFDGAIQYATVSSSQEPDKPSVKIRTRLNGKYEWKGRIFISDPFSKIRRSLSTLYGLKKPELLVLEFDGEIIQDTDTADDLGLEDDYILDLKVDKKLYDAAVAAASSKH